MSSYNSLLEATITSTIVVLIIVSIRLIFKEKLSGKLKYYLWVIFLIRLMAVPLPQSALSIYNFMPEKSTVNYEGGINNVPVTNESISNSIASQNSSNNNNLNNLNNNSNNIANKTEQGLDTGSIISGIYITGVILFLVISLVSYISFLYRFRNKSIKVEDEAMERLEIIKGRLNIRRKIQLIYGDTPFIYGIFKVKLVIPKGLALEELDSILIHELIHYKYGDLLINWVLIILRAIYWFNPIVWLSFRQIRKDCEVACDERVLESKFVDKKSYATVLFKNALKGNRYIVGTSSFSKEGSNIKGRIKLIQKFSKKTTLWTIAGVLLFVLIGAVALTNSVNNVESNVNISNDESKIIREYLNEKLNDDKKTVGEPYVAFKILGSTDNEIYLWALAEKGDSGISVPVLLNVNRDNDSLEIISYTIPRDGSLYSEDIKKMFPKDVQYKIQKYGGNVSELVKEIEEMKSNNDNKLDESNENETVVEIKNAKLVPNQSLGADMVTLDFASDDLIVFHGYFGLYIYSLSEEKIINSIDLEYINCNATQGDNYCEVNVCYGRYVQMHNISSNDMYVYDIYENTLIKKAYEKPDGYPMFIPTPEKFKDASYLTSSEAVEFKGGEIGYLDLTDGTINSLEYVRGDKRVKIFE